MEQRPIESADFDDTGYSYTLSLIAGKYKPVTAVSEEGGGQDPEPEPEGAGGGRPHPSGGLSPDPAPGGILPDGAGPFPGPGAGQALRLGDRKQTVNRPFTGLSETKEESKYGKKQQSDYHPKDGQISPSAAPWPWSSATPRGSPSAGPSSMGF